MSAAWKDWQQRVEDELFFAKRHPKIALLKYKVKETMRQLNKGMISSSGATEILDRFNRALERVSSVDPNVIQYRLENGNPVYGGTYDHATRKLTNWRPDGDTIMCQCTPAIRTPFCGEGDCQWPEQELKQGNVVTKESERKTLAFKFADLESDIWMIQELQTHLSTNESMALRAAHRAMKELVRLMPEASEVI